MRLASFAVLGLALGVLCGNAHAAGTWQESWSGLGNWTGITGGLGCSSVSGGRLTMTCESGALLSTRTFDRRQNLTVEADVSCQAAVGDDFWCSLVIWAREDATRAEYASLELASDDGSAPGGAGSPQASYLFFSPYSQGRIASYAPGTTRRLKLAYTAATQKVTMTVNGGSATTKAFRPRNPLHVWLGAIAYGEGRGGPNRARGVFGPVTVTSG